MINNLYQIGRISFPCFVFLVIWSNDLIGQDPGISQVSPVEPFINGTFPAFPPGLGSGQDEVVYKIENAFPNLTFTDPVKLLEMPGNKFMVIGKSGHVWVFDNLRNVSSKVQVLNIKSQVEIGGDGGVLGGVLHPDFGQEGSTHKGHFYLWYRYTPQKGIEEGYAYLRLSRFTYDPSKNVVDQNSEFVLIQQFDRHDWHNGGDMFFGPNGLLYLSIGDEGGGNDEFNVTQQIDKWLFSGILRIDVDERGGNFSHPIRRQPRNQAQPPQGWPSSFTQGYFIPNDNPWLDESGGVLEEFFALGTRSPHRMTYDEETGDIWVGDVGQRTQEEISIVGKGDNLQWPYREGAISGPKAKPNNLIGKDKAPIYSYGRQEGASVIGGYVYREDKFPELKGKFIFGDHETQNISLLSPNIDKTRATIEFLLRLPTEGESPKDGLSSFALDKQGNIYMLDLFGTDMDGGKIRKLVREGGENWNAPEKLSELGVFSNLDPLIPADFLIPYELNVPFWSDGAHKRRWIILPNKGNFNDPQNRVIFNSKENWTFPVGTVLIKHFDLPLDYRNPSLTQKLETRFFIYTQDENSYGVTYKWNEEGTEAFLLRDGETETYAIVAEDGSSENLEWLYPSMEQCASCHNENAGWVLGVRTQQLNKVMQYPASNREADQLFTWDFLGIFDAPLKNRNHLIHVDPLTLEGTSEEFRVRSYLDANCAYCHRPGGVSGVFDARISTPLYQTKMINAEVVSNNSPEGARILIPGEVENSHILHRSISLESDAMPPIGRSKIDEPFISLMQEWISNLDPKLPSNISESWYVIESVDDEEVISLQDNSKEEEAIFETRPYDRQGSQIWFLQNMGNRKFTLIAMHSNKAMAYSAMKSQEGESIVQETFRESQDQYWYFFAVGNQEYVIRNVYNGLYLGKETTSSLSLWKSSISEAQRWKLQIASDDLLESCTNSEITFLSDLDWAGTPENGWGPVELDQSNGETEPNDGQPLQINGSTYEKGLGVHAESEIIFSLNGSYDIFISDIGIDDEACSNASVQFEVFIDGVAQYTSPLMKRNDRARHIEIPLTGAQELKLVVNNGSPALAEDSQSCDHANWADARLIGCSEEQTVGIHNSLGGNIEIFPNPTSDFIHINWDQSKVFGVLQVECFSLEGKKLLNTYITSPSDIKIGDFPSGMYIVKLSQGSNSFLEKVWVW